MVGPVGDLDASCGSGLFLHLFLCLPRLGQAYGELLSAWCTLRRALARLEMAWQGDQAEDFLLEGNRLLSQLWDRGEELYRMGLDLCNTYKEIERLYTLL